MALTDAEVRRIKACDRTVKRFDERGLHLLIEPRGSKLWRLKYYFEGREKLLSLGSYPDVSLADARKQRDDARKKVAAGIDPVAARKAEKLAHANTFRAVATDWLKKQETRLAADTVLTMRRWLEEWVYQKIGSRPIGTMKAADLLPVLKRVEDAGRIDTAHRVRSVCGQVWRYAVANGWAERDISQDTKGALTARKNAHHAALTDPRRIGELLRSIDGYRGQPVTEIALRIAPYVFVRPGELRTAEWSEFSLKGTEPEWRIPAAKTKMRRKHIVPLASQVVRLLLDLQVHSGDGKYLFPILKDASRPMSENTINSALRRLDFGADEMTAHGFRTTASTILNELGVPPDIVERQLAHREQNATRDAYNRAERLPERRAMMLMWADHLDALRAAKALG